MLILQKYLVFLKKISIYLKGIFIFADNMYLTFQFILSNSVLITHGIFKITHHCIS